MTDATSPSNEKWDKALARLAPADRAWLSRETRRKRSVPEELAQKLRDAGVDVQAWKFEKAPGEASYTIPEDLARSLQARREWAERLSADIKASLELDEALHQWNRANGLETCTQCGKTVATDSEEFGKGEMDGDDFLCGPCCATIPGVDPAEWTALREVVAAPRADAVERLAREMPTTLMVANVGVLLATMDAGPANTKELVGVLMAEVKRRDPDWRRETASMGQSS